VVSGAPPALARARTFGRKSINRVKFVKLIPAARREATAAAAAAANDRSMAVSFDYTGRPWRLALPPSDCSDHPRRSIVPPALNHAIVKPFCNTGNPATVYKYVRRGFTCAVLCGRGV